MKNAARTLRSTGVIAVALLLVLSACATAPDKRLQKFSRGTHGLTVLLMPMDVELSELNAGGVLEPKAAWTAAARKNMKMAIAKIMAERKARLVSYAAPAEDAATAGDQQQLVKLHGVVGEMMLMNSFGAGLPTKKDRFDWTLGPDVRALRSQGEAEYALFVFVRDSYTSTGRAAVMVVAAVLGVGIQGGQQLGFASLVDLKTGDIVWFNRLLRGTGDLRNEEDAMKSVKLLLADLPK